MKRAIAACALFVTAAALSACSPPPRDYATYHPEFYTDVYSLEEVRDTAEQILKNHYSEVRRKSDLWVVTEPQIDKDQSRLLKEWSEALIEEDSEGVAITIYVYEQVSSAKTDFGDLDVTHPQWGARTRDHTKEKQLVNQLRDRLEEERRYN